MVNRPLTVHYGEIWEFEVTSLALEVDVMDANCHFLTKEWYHLQIENTRLVDH